MGEQVVEKRVLQRQTKKQMTVCFDQLCSKINRESEVQKGQFNKQIAKNLQQKNIKVSSITVWRYMTKRKRKKIPLLSEKAKESPFEIRQETRKADSRRLGQLFIYR